MARQRFDRQLLTYEYGWGFIQSEASTGTTVCAGCIFMHPIVKDAYSNNSITTLYKQMLMARLQDLENQTMDQFLHEKRSLQTHPVASI
ncbi:unnamed protein product [Phytophthora lilii]|uniref:Unnamed protein product n=1 Tax=Phytophthora lilii TaxID=2077276 RepID=A0A9W7CJE0_9STRA|nr:unnamed protein product [Phytophthora lilii]